MTEEDEAAGRDERRKRAEEETAGMGKVSVLVAEGFEEVECLAVVDLLRRAKIETEMVSVTGSRVVTGSHRIEVVTDRLIEEADFSETELLFLPGGGKGVANLSASAAVARAVRNQLSAGKRAAAICAAPSILGKMGYFAHRDFTCYPGWQDGIDGVDGARWTGRGVMTTGDITTGRGMGYAVDFGLELVRILKGEAEADALAERIQHPGTVEGKRA